MYNPSVDISDERWTKAIHNALPSFMNQDPNSNNQKMLQIYSEFGNDLKNDILDVLDQVSLNNASGKALDRLCHDWGITIVDENDNEFKRFQLRFQLMSRILKPSQLKDAISFLFNIDPSNFRIESFDIKTIKIDGIPFNFNSGDKAQLKRQLITQYIRSMLPPEFELQSVGYQAKSIMVVYTCIYTPRSPMFFNAFQS